MTSRRLLVIPAVLLIVLWIGLPVTNVNAQSETDTTTPLTGTLWLRVDLDAEDSDESAPQVGYVLLELDADRLLLVADGADVVYTQDAGEIYRGTPLVELSGIVSESELTFVDEDTIEITSVTRTGALNLESTITLSRSEFTAQVWVEDQRVLQEFSMFAECMGLMGATPPGTLVRRDPIVHVRIDEDAGILYLGNKMFTGGGSFERTTESEFGSFTQVITETAVVSDSAIDLTYYAVAGERDDCEVRYTSVFIPYDGDTDALLMRAAEIAAE